MMNQFYKFIFIVINVWLSSPVLFCSTYSDNMKEAVPFHLDYTSTPFSFNFQLNPDDYIMESSDSCSYKLFKSENENYVIISSNDCSMSNINNLEPATEYSIEFVFGHGRRLSIKRTKLTTESLNYQVIHFGLKAFEYVSVHSFFDENQNEMCRLYDSDTGEQLNCGKKDECNCKTDIVTNLETGKSYNIRIVKINGTNLGHLSVKTMIKPEFDVSSDSNGLNVKYDYKDIITMPKSCKLFIINNDNSSEALNTESIDLLEHNPAVQETDCNSISNIKLEEKSEQTSHHLILTDRFNQQIHSLTMYSQNRITVILISVGMKSIYFFFDGPNFNENDRCYAVNDNNKQEFDCADENALGERCSCLTLLRIINLDPGRIYEINTMFNRESSPITNTAVTMPSPGTIESIYYGINGLNYRINLSPSNIRVNYNCRVCLYHPGTDQEGGCCKNVIISKIDSLCEGLNFESIESGQNLILQGCDFNGDEWIRMPVYTASLPTNVLISRIGNTLDIQSIYPNNQLIPSICYAFINNNNNIQALLCTSINQCSCTRGQYFTNSDNIENSTIIVTDYDMKVIFTAFVRDGIFYPSINIPTEPPTTEEPTTEPTTEPIESPQARSIGTLGGAIAGVVIAVVVICIGVSYGLYRLSKSMII